MNVPLSVTPRRCQVVRGNGFLLKPPFKKLVKNNVLVCWSRGGISGQWIFGAADVWSCFWTKRGSVEPSARLDFTRTGRVRQEWQLKHVLSVFTTRIKSHKLAGSVLPLQANLSQSVRATDCCLGSASRTSPLRGLWWTQAELLRLAGHFYCLRASFLTVTQERVAVVDLWDSQMPGYITVPSCVTLPGTKLSCPL